MSRNDQITCKFRIAYVAAQYSGKFLWFNLVLDIFAGQGSRPTEQIALDVITACFAHRIEVLHGFNAFCRHGDSQIPGEMHDGVDDSRTFAAIAKALYEAAINLDLVEIELVQMGERRVARTEIIERKPDAEGFEVAQDAGGVFDVFHQGIFRQFQLKP